MIVSFKDLENEDNPHNGLSIGDEFTAARILCEEIERGDAHCVMLQSEAGDFMTIGIGAKLGCIEHTTLDERYLWAIDPERSSIAGIETFLMGGTATEVPRARCLPIETVITLVRTYVATGKRGEDVRWVET